MMSADSARSCHVSNKDINFDDICARLEGSSARAAAILNGDIQEAKAWILKIPKLLEEINRLSEENKVLKERLADTQGQEV